MKAAPCITGPSSTICAGSAICSAPRFAILQIPADRKALHPRKCREHVRHTTIADIAEDMPCFPLSSTFGGWGVYCPAQRCHLTGTRRTPPLGVWYVFHITRDQVDMDMHALLPGGFTDVNQYVEPVGAETR